MRFSLSLALLALALFAAFASRADRSTHDTHVVTSDPPMRAALAPGDLDHAEGW